MVEPARGARTTGLATARCGAFVRAPLVCAALAVLACGVASPGCSGPGGQFYVVQNQVAGAGCTIPADKGALYQGEGTLDVRVPTTRDAAYLLFPLLQNDLPVEGDMGVEPNRIALSGFEVDLRLVTGSQMAADFFASLAADPASVDAALLRYQSPWSGSVAPGGGVTAASTSVFSAELARRLRDGNVLANGSEIRVAAQVRAVGNKVSGRIKSDVFTYPIRVCDGCLINSITSCPATSAVLKGGVCNAGQDAPVDCCTQGADLVCPASTAP